jgi:hypothetical protein
VALNDEWTLLDLRDFIREAGDYWDPAYPDTLVNNWINSAIQAWSDFVLELDDTRFMKEGQIAIASGTDSYDLKDTAVLTADDYYRARGLSVEDSGSPSGYSRLERVQWSQRHDHSYSSHKLAAKWDIQGDDLLIWPKPSWTAAVLLEYVPLPAKLDRDVDTVDLRSNVDFIVTWVCMRLAPRDESSKKNWTELHDAARGGMASSSPQNIGQVKRVVSVYGDRRFRDLRRHRRLIP